ncbi:MAG TPA: prolipoprotein diacylglyceryl transferase [Gemmatimonadales bacterium]|nr:prolipoprotein diacylglyceryl transferase [Gemmatimonadales bacterium]
MRPTIMQYLEGAGFDWLAALVPRPGLMYGIALVILTFVFLRRARIAGLDHQRALEIVLSAAVGAVIGTRLFYLVTTGDVLRLDVASWFNLSRGTASWGAYLGGIIGTVLYTGVSRIPVWPYLDTAASVVALGPFIARWSCFLKGDDFGRVSDVAWAVQFPAGSLPYQAHVAAGLLPPTAEASLAVHPFQLYLLVNGLVVFLIVSAIWRRWRDRPGVTFGSFLLIYGATRFPWEFLRDPAGGGAAANDLLSTSQWMCLLLIAGGMVVLATGTKRKSLAAHSTAPAP